MTEQEILFLFTVRDTCKANPELVAKVVDAANSGLRDRFDEMRKLSAALKLAKEVLEDAHQNINPERGYADEIESDIEKAIAAIAAAPTPPVSEDWKDAERYHKLVAYLVSDCTEFDDAIIAARTRDEMNTVIDTM